MKIGYIVNMVIDITKNLKFRIVEQVQCYDKNKTHFDQFIWINLPSVEMLN